MGTALIMGAAIPFILALQYGGARESWSSSIVVGLLVGFILILITFAILELWQGERAMLTPRLMRDRHVWVNGLYGFFFCVAYFVPLYYLPIYFQSIDNVSPIASGVRNLPLIIAFSVGAVLSGGAISKTGVATPILTASAVITTVAAGLLYTLDVGSGASKWIGYQILTGLGFGVGFQVPIIVVQATAQPTDLASATAIILCQSYFRSPVELMCTWNADNGYPAQFLKLLAAHFSSLPHNPDSSTSFCATSRAPWLALIQL
jgi:MFS family permease